MKKYLVREEIRDSFGEDFVSTILSFDPMISHLIFGAIKLELYGSLRELISVCKISAQTVRRRVMGLHRDIEKYWKMESQIELRKFFLEIQIEVLKTSRSPSPGVRKEIQKLRKEREEL